MRNWCWCCTCHTQSLSANRHNDCVSQGHSNSKLGRGFLISCHLWSHEHLDYAFFPDLLDNASRVQQIMYICNMYSALCRVTVIADNAASIVLQFAKPSVILFVSTWVTATVMPFSGCCYRDCNCNPCSSSPLYRSDFVSCIVLCSTLLLFWYLACNLAPRLVLEGSSVHMPTYTHTLMEWTPGLDPTKNSFPTLLIVLSSRSSFNLTEYVEKKVSTADASVLSQCMVSSVHKHAIPFLAI